MKKFIVIYFKFPAITKRVYYDNLNKLGFDKEQCLNCYLLDIKEHCFYGTNDDIMVIRVE